MASDDSVSLTLDKVLKTLRAERNLSVEDISQQTRISIQKLQWLEEGEFEKFEAPVFVRGYIRSYAKVVAGDADNLVALYDETLIEDDQAIAVSIASNTALNKASTSSAKQQLLAALKGIPIWAIAGLIILVLAVVLFVGGGESSDSSVSSSQENPSVQASTAQAESESENGAEMPSEVLSYATSEVIEEASGVDSEAAVSEPVSPSALPVSDPSSFEQVGEEDDLSAPLSTSELAQSRLDFSFSDDCWVEVIDATDKVIFADLKNKGDNLRLFGLAPFSVMLGNAKAVTLNVDDKPVDIRVSGSRNTLRLSVYSPQ